MTSDEKKLIERIFDHVENDDVDKAVFACLRLSRNVGDVYNSLLFLRELRPDKNQSDQAFYDEVKGLNKEAQDFYWKSVTDHWIKGRTLDYSVTEDPDKTVMVMGVGEMQKEITHLKETISDLKVPSGMDGYDLAAFTDRYDLTKSQLRLRMNGINSILERIRTRCLNFASRIENQISGQEKAESFLLQVQNEVNSYFSSRSEDTYMKLRKASDLLGSSDPEDNALLLTTIRRAIQSAADHFYPPTSTEVECIDGKKRLMGKDQYLNRLHEFVFRSFGRSTSTELMKAELNYLLVFARKMNEIASKGVHTEVTTSEAKQGLLGLYLFLSNVIAKLEHVTPNKSIQPTAEATAD